MVLLTSENGQKFGALYVESVGLWVCGLASTGVSTEDDFVVDMIHANQTWHMQKPFTGADTKEMLIETLANQYQVQVHDVSYAVEEWVEMK